MLNYIWLGLILAAVLMGGATGHLKELTDGAFDATKTGVMTVALPLVGIMALWLGIMRLAEKSGLVQVLARALRPVLRLLFPEVPAGASRHGGDGDEHRRKYAGPGQCGNSPRVAGHATAGTAEPAPGDSDQCHVHFPGDQYQFRATHPSNRGLHSRQCRLDAIPQPSSARRWRQRVARRLLVSSLSRRSNACRCSPSPNEETFLASRAGRIRSHRG